MTFSGALTLSLKYGWLHNRSRHIFGTIWGKESSMQAPNVSHQEQRYQWVVVLVTVFGTFLSALDQTIVNIAIPRFQLAFSADIGSVQWVLTVYLLAQGVATPLAAYFADTLGMKRFYVISLAIFTLASLLCGLAPTLPLLVVFRIVQGLGSAALVPLSLAMI